MSGKKDSLINRKLDWSLLLHDLRGELKLVAEVLHFAAYDKVPVYGPRNWMGGGEDFVYELHNAIERHRTAILEGQYLDPDTGKPHRAHIIASELFLLHFEEQVFNGTMAVNKDNTLNPFKKDLCHP